MPKRSATSRSNSSWAAVLWGFEVAGKSGTIATITPLTDELIAGRRQDHTERSPRRRTLSSVSVLKKNLARAGNATMRIAAALVGQRRDAALLNEAGTAERANVRRADLASRCTSRCTLRLVASNSESKAPPCNPVVFPRRVECKQHTQAKWPNERAP